jgi:phenylpropionate dioxygenase-like ring-hydroxylating dioxygenase large terminal subunit
VATEATRRATAGVPAVIDTVRSGFTPPAAWYTDRAFFDHEQTVIFSRSWQYVALTSELRNPGDFVRGRLGRVPIVITRDGEGRLHGLVNVCRHRCSEVVLEQRGNRQTLQCHYHAWTYELDGTLRSAPRSEAEPGFDKSQFGLVTVAVDSFGPFIFATLNRSAAPLAETLGALPELVASTGIDLDGLELRERREYDMRANWKVVVENFLECYHCPVSHPAFGKLVDLDQYHLEEHGWVSSQRVPVKGDDGRRSDEAIYDASEGVREGRYSLVFPNFMLNIFPGPGNASSMLNIPLAPDRTVMIQEFFFSPGVQEAAASEIVDFVDQIQQEDVVLCESVQRGLEAGVINQGRVMVERGELLVNHFQRLLAATIAES